MVVTTCNKMTCGTHTNTSTAKIKLGCTCSKLQFGKREFKLQTKLKNLPLQDAFGAKIRCRADPNTSDGTGSKACSNDFLDEIVSVGLFSVYVIAWPSATIYAECMQSVRILKSKITTRRGLLIRICGEEYLLCNSKSKKRHDLQVWGHQEVKQKQGLLLTSTIRSTCRSEIRGWEYLEWVRLEVWLETVWSENKEWKRTSLNKGMFFSRTALQHVLCPVNLCLSKPRRVLRRQC
jgi:hypothetical protein